MREGGSESDGGSRYYCVSAPRANFDPYKYNVNSRQFAYNVRILIHNYINTHILGRLSLYEEIVYAYKCVCVCVFNGYKRIYPLIFTHHRFSRCSREEQ